MLISEQLYIVRHVREFHRAGEVPTPSRPCIPPPDRVALRKSLISEEVGETLKGIDDEDLVEIADGIVDSIVVLVGTALEYGIDLTPVWNAVHKANMAKFPACEECGGDSIHSAVKSNDLELYDSDTGVKRVCAHCNGRGTQLILRDDGKVLKPKGWTAPDVGALLLDQARG